MWIPTADRPGPRVDWRTEMATEPHDQLRRSQPLQLSKEELLRRAKPFEPLPGPLFDDLPDEEEEAFWNAVNE